MSTPRYNDICRKVEDAIEKLIQANARDELIGVAIHKGFTNAEQQLPSVRIIATPARAEVEGSTLTGNWFVDVRIVVGSNYDDTGRDTKEGMAALVFDIFLSDDLTTRLNAGPTRDVTFFGDEANPASAFPQGEPLIERSADGHQHLESLTIPGLYCAPTRIEGTP